MKKHLFIALLLIPSLCSPAPKSNLQKGLNATIAASKIAVGLALASKGSNLIAYLIASETNKNMAKEFSTSSAYLFHGCLLLGGIYNIIDGARSF